MYWKMYADYRKEHIITTGMCTPRLAEIAHCEIRNLQVHIPENRNASSATSEQRSAPNRMNNYNAIMMAGSYLVHSSPDDRSVQPVGG